MILGIGTDMVAINRFASWQQFSHERLQRIFTQSELDYSCTLQGDYQLERLAARFAAKEAFYKALSSAISKINPDQKMVPFLTVAPLVEVKNGQFGVPILQVNWRAFGEHMTFTDSPMTIHLSLSHEKDYALAFVVLEA